MVAEPRNKNKNTCMHAYIRTFSTLTCHSASLTRGAYCSMHTCLKSAACEVQEGFLHLAPCCVRPYGRYARTRTPCSTFFLHQSTSVAPIGSTPCLAFLAPAVWHWSGLGIRYVHFVVLVSPATHHSKEHESCTGNHSFCVMRAIHQGAGLTLCGSRRESMMNLAPAPSTDGVFGVHRVVGSHFGATGCLEEFALA